MNIATGTVRDRETRVRNVAEQDKKEHTCNLETL
jgi:hypothetical protein